MAEEGKVYAHKIRIIFFGLNILDISLMPHVALYFKNLNHERPLIKGVDVKFVKKYVLGHPKVQEWTVEEIDGVWRLLVPKTYAILKLFKIHKIYLEFKDKA